MTEKSKYSVSTYITSVAILGFLVCMCCKAFQIGDLYRQYSYDVELSTIMQVYFEHLNDYIIYLALALGVFLCPRDTKALPVVLLTYMVYCCLITAGRFLFLDSGTDSDLLGVMTILCGLVGAIIWTIKPQNFKSGALLFIPYILYIPFALITKHLQDFEWMTFTYNIAEMILFVGIVLKCTTNEDHRQTSSQLEYYWMPAIAIIIAQCIAYIAFAVA